MKSVDLKNINSNIDYNLRFPSGNYINAFKWMKNFPLIGKEISSKKLYYSPSNFSTGIKINKVSKHTNYLHNKDLFEIRNAQNKTYPKMIPYGKLVLLQIGGTVCHI